MKNQILKVIDIFLIVTFCFKIATATSFSVGTGKTYQTPNALYLANVLSDSDTILIEPESFTGNACLAAWSKNNLVIIGLGPQKTKLVANGSYIQGKGIWVFIGNNITVENIEFSGAAVPDQNGAGIRLDGSGMTVRHCYFHDNEDGILTSNPGTGDILVEYTEFAYNGFGDGQSHNLYIGRVNSLTFRYNYSHHAKIGHNLKTRAKENYIEYNRIMDEDVGTSSYLIDMSNGGLSIVKGNLLMQGLNTDNCNLVAFGLEGFPSGYQKELYFIHNTLINRRSPGCNFINISSSATSASIYNNIFTGLGSVVGSYPATLGGNLIEPIIANVNLVNEGLFDYQLLANSPARDIGVLVPPLPGLDFTVDKSYLHPQNFTARLSNGPLDAGAYEYQSVLAISEDNNKYSNLTGHTNQVTCYPNPTNGSVILPFEIEQVEYVKLINSLGQVLHENKKSNLVDLANYPTGKYYIFIKPIKRDPKVFSIIKL